MHGSLCFFVTFLTVCFEPVSLISCFRHASSHLKLTWKKRLRLSLVRTKWVLSVPEMDSVVLVVAALTLAVFCSGVLDLHGGGGTEGKSFRPEVRHLVLLLSCLLPGLYPTVALHQKLLQQDHKVRTASRV